MQRRKRNLLTLGAIGFGILLFVILGVVQTDKSHKTIAFAGNNSNAQEGLPTIGGPFELVDKDGKLWKDSDFKGKPTLVYFGYTFCPDICPMALSHMTKAMNELGGAKVIQPLFVTIDPHRDTPEFLKSYAENFHKDFIMLTGNKTQVDQAIKAYRVYAARASEEGGADDYLMDHSSLIYLMGKDGKYYANFNHKTPPHEIVERVKLYLEKGQ